MGAMYSSYRKTQCSKILFLVEHFHEIFEAPSLKVISAQKSIQIWMFTKEIWIDFYALTTRQKNTSKLDWSSEISRLLVLKKKLRNFSWKWTATKKCSFKNYFFPVWKMRPIGFWSVRGFEKKSLPPKVCVKWGAMIQNHKSILPSSLTVFSQVFPFLCKLFSKYCTDLCLLSLK